LGGGDVGLGVWLPAALSAGCFFFFLNGFSRLPLPSVLPPPSVLLALPLPSVLPLPLLVGGET
jgi:hypothetical protein